MSRVMRYGDPGVPRTWINASGQFSARRLASVPWQRRGLCVGRDARPWFARWDAPSAKSAQEICSSCPVKAQCLAWALLCGDEYGIWGGLNPLERLALEGLLAAGAPLGEVVQMATHSLPSSVRGAA